jgi:hypothetical protein
MGKTYVILWRVEQLKEANDGYKVQEFIPGLMLIGSNGGGEAFGFDQRRSPWQYVMIPFIVMLWEDAIPLGETFAHFVKRLRSGPFKVASTAP